MEKVFEIYIRTTPERLWEAITDPEIRSKYNFGARVRSDWTPGSRYEMGHPAAPGLLEQLQVLHHAEARHREALGKRAGGLPVLAEELVEQAPASRIGEGPEHVVHVEPE